VGKKHQQDDKTNNGRNGGARNAYEQTLEKAKYGKAGTATEPTVGLWVPANQISPSAGTTLLHPQLFVVSWAQIYVF